MNKRLMGIVFIAIAAWGCDRHRHRHDDGPPRTYHKPSPYSWAPYERGEIDDDILRSRKEFDEEVADELEDIEEEYFDRRERFEID